MNQEPKLDRNLNLVFEFEDGVYAYVRPIAQDLWRTYRVPLALTLDEIAGMTRAGVTVAADLFRESCTKRGADPEPFFAEIKRCTPIGFPDDKEGFAQVPFGIAKNTGKIGDEETRHHLAETIPIFRIRDVLEVKNGQGVLHRRRRGGFEGGFR